MYLFSPKKTFFFSNSRVRFTQKCIYFPQKTFLSLVLRGNRKVCFFKEGVGGLIFQENIHPGNSQSCSVHCTVQRFLATFHLKICMLIPTFTPISIFSNKILMIFYCCFSLKQTFMQKRQGRKMSGFSLYDRKTLIISLCTQ